MGPRAGHHEILAMEGTRNVHEESIDSINNRSVRRSQLRNSCNGLVFPASNFGSVAHTIESLAVEPRWEQSRVESLPGRCRGDLVGAWGPNLIARFGAGAVDRVRQRRPAALDQLPPVLTARDWIPVHGQLLLTEAITDEFLGGDMRALYPLLVEDTRAGVGRVQLMLLRTLGPRGAFRLAPRTFRKVHECGTVDGEVASDRARMAFRGSPLFAHPTWRLLQLYAMQMMLELASSPGIAMGEDGGPDSFVAIATW
jgi:hypothetical protein